MADEHGVDLSQVEGTGRRGRVTKKDLLAFIENLAADEMASLTARRRIPSTRELSRLLNGAGPQARKSLPRQRARTAK